MFNEATNSLVENIKQMVISLMADADFDRTYTGYVVSKEATKDGQFIYTVRVNGMDHTIKSKLKYEVNNHVLVLVPRNMWSNAKLLYIG